MIRRGSTTAWQPCTAFGEEIVTGKIIRIASTAAIAVAVSALFLLQFAVEAPAQSTELRLLVSDGMKPALEALVPEIERATGRPLKAHFDSSKRLAENVLGGEACDVALLTSDVIADLIKQGKLAAGTSSEIARTGIGVGVRAGAPKPEIGTAESLKRAILNAKFISFNPTGASAVHNHEMLQRLGIADEMKSKLLLDPGPGMPQQKVAEGKADLVFTLIPEIKFFHGVDYVGPVPAEFQNYINFAAAVSASTKNPEAAKTVIQFLKTPKAAATMTAKGVEPR
jgi:molybdate transport system substrate-binding protein